MEARKLEREARRAVRANKIILLLLAVLCCALLAGALRLALRPLGEHVTLKGLAAALEGDSLDARTAEADYEVERPSGLAELLELDGWTRTEGPAVPGEPLVVLRFWEEYELALYPGELAEAWDGYAGPGVRGAAWYQIPEEAAEGLLTWLEEYAAPSGGSVRFRLWP